MLLLFTNSNCYYVCFSSYINFNKDIKGEYEMYRIELNKNIMGFTIEKSNVNLYSDNDVIEDNCFISIYCSKKELIQEYKYKLLSKLQRRLGKQIALIKQAKKEINSEGYNYTYGGVKVLRKRLRVLKCAYNLSKDESIKEQIDKLEEIIKIKEGVER